MSETKVIAVASILSESVELEEENGIYTVVKTVEGWRVAESEFPEFEDAAYDFEFTCERIADRCRENSDVGIKRNDIIDVVKADDRLKLKY
jgi:hypothetical protein